MFDLSFSNPEIDLVLLLMHQLPSFYISFSLSFFLFRAGAVGINLTQANRVFIMEPCLNPAIEAQAIGRVYRLGQQRPVKITRLIMENSIETRIREMLENKYGSSEGNNSNTTTATTTSTSPPVEDDSDGDGSNSNKKPAPTTTTEAPPVASFAVIGSLRTEKTAVLTLEFDLLFGVDELEEQNDDDDDNDDYDEDNGGGRRGAAGGAPDTVLSLMTSSAAAGRAGTMQPESI
jgi:hypothetical protein